MHNPDSPQFYSATFDTQITEFINQHREMLIESLSDLTEEEARRSLVPSKTTLLGLVKHAIFVEQVWFQEASTGNSRDELGIPEIPGASFELDPNDTIENVLTRYRATIKTSDQIAEDYPQMTNLLATVEVP